MKTNDPMLALVERLAADLMSFSTDPPDTDYQRGYLGAIEELLRAALSCVGAPRENSETIGAALQKLLVLFPSQTFRQHVLMYLSLEEQGVSKTLCGRTGNAKSGLAAR